MKKVLSSVPLTAPKEEGAGIGDKILNTIKRAAEGPQFKLEGVVNAPDGYKAIINGALVGPGETIDGADVVDITKRTAKLKYKGKEMLIEMK